MHNSKLYFDGHIATGERDAIMRNSEKARSFVIYATGNIYIIW